MGLFRRKAQDLAVTQAASSPPAQTASRSLTVELLDGVDVLEVVGESYRQDELSRIVGGRTEEYVEHPVIAVLMPEPSNPHDPNAIAVWVHGGAQVGYLPRELAARYRPGLLALQAKYGRLIALKG